MGKKSVFTDDPAEKIDRGVLEITIPLSSEEAKSLAIALRVTIQLHSR